MIVLTLQGTVESFERRLAQHGKVARASMVWALNRAMAEARTEIVKKVVSTVKDAGVPAKFVRERVRVQRASNKRLFSSLITLTAGIPIDRLKYRRLKKRGIKAGRRHFPHAFVAFKDRAKPLVFQRRGAERLPIDRVKLDIKEEADRVSLAAFNRVASTKLGPLFERELQRRLK